jgi:hypothetical protein
MRGGDDACQQFASQQFECQQVAYPCKDQQTTLNSPGFTLLNCDDTNIDDMIDTLEKDLQAELMTDATIHEFNTQSELLLANHQDTSIGNIQENNGMEPQPLQQLTMLKQVQL